jgi:hypothetical protein
MITAGYRNSFQAAVGAESAQDVSDVIPDGLDAEMELACNSFG